MVYAAGRMLRRDCLKLGLAVPALLAANAAQASQFLPVSLAELVRSSERIWVGLPLEKHAEWTDGPLGRLIVTYTRVACDRDVLESSGPTELWVRTLGGSIGKVGQFVPGEAKLSLGRRCLVFLSRPAEYHAVNAMAQGHYAIRPRDGVPLLEPSEHALPARSRRDSAVARLMGQPLDRGVEHIRSVRP